MKRVNGRLKLEKRDRQVGNFVITDEENHYKVQDINGQINHRFGKRTMIGRALAIMMAEGHEKFLSVWLSVTMLSFSVVPDSEFLSDVLNASNACIERHRKDFYVADAETDGDNEKILMEQKKLHEDFEDAERDAAQSSE